MGLRDRRVGNFTYETSGPVTSRTTRTTSRTTRTTSRTIRTTPISSPPWGAPYMYGSDGPGGDSGGPGGGSGGPGGGSETVFGTDVRNRQCSEQCSEPTKLGRFFGKNRAQTQPLGTPPGGNESQEPPPPSPPLPPPGDPPGTSKKRV